jgi:hypothetical protein
VRRLYFLLTALCLALPFSARAMPVDLSAPGGSLGYQDNKGGLSYSIDLQEADFGDGIKLPVRFTFNSKKRGLSPYGWTGFTCGILESKATLANSIAFNVILPCTKEIYLQNGYAQFDPGAPIPPVNVLRHMFSTMDTQWKGTAISNSRISPGLPDRIRRHRCREVWTALLFPGGTAGP